MVGGSTVQHWILLGTLNWKAISINRRGDEEFSFYVILPSRSAPLESSHLGYLFRTLVDRAAMADDLRRSPMLHALRALQFKSAGRAQGGDYFSAELSLTIPDE